MTSTYLVNSSNKLSALAKQFKNAHINQENEVALELLRDMEVKIKFMKAELEDRMAVKA
jgi:hypothetical protein